MKSWIFKLYKSYEIPILILFLLLIFIALPFLFTLNGPDWFINLGEEPAKIGDAFNGITAPFIAAVAAILTYKAFRVQYEANRKLEKFNEVNRFENSFYNLINLIRASIKDFQIQGDHENLYGILALRKVFHEHKEISKLLEAVSYPQGIKSTSDISIYINAYRMFYYGKIAGRRFNFENLANTIDSEPISGSGFYKIVVLTQEQNISSTNRFGYEPLRGHEFELNPVIKLFKELLTIIDSSPNSDEQNLSYFKIVFSIVPDYFNLFLYLHSISISDDSSICMIYYKYNLKSLTPHLFEEDLLNYTNC